MLFCRSFLYKTLKNYQESQSRSYLKKRPRLPFNRLLLGTYHRVDCILEIICINTPY